MRENAILPKSVNGNFMDVYASAIACVSWEDFHNNGFNQTSATSQCFSEFLHMIINHPVIAHIGKSPYMV